MAKSVEQIRAQIAKLQEREKVLLQKEAIGVVARIKEAVAHYGITAEQIFGSNGSNGAAKPEAKRTVTRKAAGKRAASARAATAKTPGTRVAKPAKASSPVKGTKVAAKFKDEAGNTWSGRGSQPRWLRAAIASGKALQDFAVA